VGSEILPTPRKPEKRGLNLELNHSDDSGTQLQRLAETTNEIIKLTEMLKVAGEFYNQTKVDLLQAETPEEIKKAKIERQYAEGKYKGILADIRCKKEIVNTIKTLAKAEHNSF
jgi:hypothetical protein